MSELIEISSSKSEIKKHVIFIHGLNGDYIKTWQSKTNPKECWLKWLSDDIDHLSVWSVKYDASFSDWTGHAMSLPDRSKNILARIVQEPKLKIGVIILIGHSLGGLVIKQLLRNAESSGHVEENKLDFLNRLKGVGFLGTPHTGSDLEYFCELVPFLIRPSPSTLDLKRNNPNLRDLNEWYRIFSSRKNVHNLILVETKSMKNLPLIVKPDSSDPGMLITPIPIDANHIDICKPIDRRSESYIHILDFISNIPETLPIDSNAEQGLPLLIQNMHDNILHFLRGYVDVHSISKFVERKEISLAIDAVINSNTPAIRIIKAKAGMGKTIWSVTRALHYSLVRPVIWTSATDLNLQIDDPISKRVMLASYGDTDADKQCELLDLLRRNEQKLVIFLDAIDEVRDIDLLRRCISNFWASEIGKNSFLFLMCRDESFFYFAESFRDFFPELFLRYSQPLSISPLSDQEAEMLLAKYGFNRKVLRSTLAAIPLKYKGIPFMLIEIADICGKAGDNNIEQQFIETISKKWLIKLQKIMKNSGRFKSIGHLSKIMRSIALITIVHSQQAITFDDVENVIGSEEGENSLKGLLIRSGFFLKGSDERYRFTHPLFLEYFAAKAIEEDFNSNYIKALQYMSNPEIIRILRRLVSNFENTLILIDILLNQNKDYFYDIASLIPDRLTAEARTIMTDQINILLESRFKSDVRRALYYLSKINDEKAKIRIIKWFNALDDNAKIRWAQYAAEIFLGMELIEAFEVILHHPDLIAYEMSWFEPSFTTQFDNLSTSFKLNLCEKAKLKLEDKNSDNHWGELIKILALGRDAELTNYLQRKLAFSYLDATDHRALIYVNSPESIALYEESVKKYFMKLEHLEKERNEKSNKDQDLEAFEVWHSLVLKQSDIRMHPHDCLVDFIKRSLLSNDNKDYFFGVEWCDTIQDPSLIRDYVAAGRRFPNSIKRMTGRFIEEVIKHSTEAEVIKLYDSHDDEEIRNEIIRSVYYCPGVEIENKVSELLKNGTHIFYAIQSLGIMGTLRAAPYIEKYLSDDETAFVAIKALGRLRYKPAVSKLIKMLEASKKDKSFSTQKENLEYSLIEALSAIGNEEALNYLFAIFQDVTFPDLLLRKILGINEQQSFDFVKKIVNKWPSAVKHVVKALRFIDLDRPWPRKSQIEIIDDKDLLKYILDYSKELLLEKREGELMDAVIILTSFPSDETVKFLEQVAEMDFNSTEDLEKLKFATEAKRSLSNLGHERYQDEVISEEISRIINRNFLSYRAADHLKLWPSESIRKVIIKRLETDYEKWQLLFLLRCYAQPEDKAIFEKYEQDKDDHVADIAHSYLIYPSQYSI